MFMKKNLKKMITLQKSLKLTVIGLLGELCVMFDNVHGTLFPLELRPMTT